MASKAIGFLNFKFGADLSGFERAMKKAQKNLKKFGKNVTKAGQNLSRNLTLPILALGAASIKAFDEQAKAEQKLLTSLKGREDIQQRLITQAKELQKTTLFGDEATIAAQSMLAMMGLTEEEVVKLIPLIQDFATAKGMDLVTAADLVAKSMGSSTNALSRYGIEITGAVGSSERLDTAVNQLTEKFEGQAEAAAKVGAGPLIQIGNQLGDIAEELGQRLMPYVTKFVDYLKTLISKFDGLTESQKDNIVKWGLILAAVGPVLIIIGKLAIGISALIPLLTSIGFLNPFTLMIAGAIAAVAVIAKVISVLTDQFNLQKQIDSVNEQARKNIADDLIKIKVSTRLLTDENTSLSFKKKLLDDLKKTYPGYYDQLDEATLSTKTLKQANDNLVNSLLKSSQIDALKGRLTEIQREILDANKSIGSSFIEDWGLTSGYTPIDILLKHLSIPSGFEGIDNLKTEAEALTNILTGLLVETSDTNEEFEKLDHTTTNLSLNTNTITEKTEKYSKALDPLIEKIKEYADVSTKMWQDGGILEGPENMLNWTEKLTKAQEAHNATMELMEDIMFSAAMSAANSQQKFFDSFIENIKKAIKQLIIQLAVLTVIALLLGGPTMKIGEAFNIAKGKVLGLEDGGLVYGPTTALIGEGVGTTASNPEVVAPLDKLKQHMGGGNQNIIVEGVLKGNDIYLSNRNTSINRLRTS